MANQIPSFSSGANLALYMDGTCLAYASNISFTDDMAHAPVGGIGSYSMDAIEPTQYAVRGSFTITQYDKNAFARTADNNQVRVPDRSASQPGGNTFLKAKYFSPSALLLQRTFDIQIYERIQATGALSSTPVFVVGDCRLTSYALTFTPGQLVSESISFIALTLTDRVAQSNATGG